jgi:hypothetical protein
MQTRTVQRICNAVLLLAVVNFLAFAIFSSILGGDALTGKIEDGHYYLRYRGKYTEVSPAVFQYSRLHALSLFVTFPLGIFAAFSSYGTKPSSKT